MANGDIFAADRRSWVDFGARCGRAGARLERYLRNHLRWSNTTKTPFISTYADKGTAFREALRRVREGMENVTISIIDPRRARPRVEFRNVRGLAENLRYEIPDKAWHNSKFEYIFLHRIPACAIVEVIDVRELASP
jgi:hypothetical protein